jgi:hypothetical protein
MLAIILPGILEPVMVAWPRPNETKKILNPYNPEAREALEGVAQQEEIVRVRERYGRLARQLESLAIQEQTPDVIARREELQAEADKDAAILERLGSPVRVAAGKKKKGEVSPESADLIHDNPATAGEGPQ